MPLADSFSASAASSSSHKAPYRPGKQPHLPQRPGMMRRTGSMCSLPSPPADSNDLHLEFGPHGLEQRLRVAPKQPVMLIDTDSEEEDQLEDEDDEDEPRSLSRTAKSALGSPANLSIAGGGGGASRKQLLNPFLLADHAPASTSSASTSHARPPRPDHPSSSPTHRSRRRVDPDRIKLTTPPQKTRAELEADRERNEVDEDKERKKREMGWDDLDNPFVDRDDGMAKRLKGKEAAKRPETLTYVKRGERIRTSIPFTAVLTSSSPTDDPFTYTAPRLLFPPAPPRTPSTPPSSFLEALRASSAVKRADPEQEGRAGLPPTPVTLKRKAPARPAGPLGVGGQGYKKMKLPASEAEHQQRGLR
ncbi:hypothetical protein JCM1841_006417 [Sporobolomyces salmonicolor]